MALGLVGGRPGVPPNSIHCTGQPLPAELLSSPNTRGAEWRSLPHTQRIKLNLPFSYSRLFSSKCLSQKLRALSFGTNWGIKRIKLVYVCVFRFFFFFFFGRILACRIIVSWPRVEPTGSPESKALNSSHWTTREFPSPYFLPIQCDSIQASIIRRWDSACFCSSEHLLRFVDDLWKIVIRGASLYTYM